MRILSALIELLFQDRKTYEAGFVQGVFFVLLALTLILISSYTN